MRHQCLPYRFARLHSITNSGLEIRMCFFYNLIAQKRRVPNLFFK
jgi:hypothetical protein